MSDTTILGNLSPADRVRFEQTRRDLEELQAIKEELRSLESGHCDDYQRAEALLAVAERYLHAREVEDFEVRAHDAAIKLGERMSPAAASQLNEAQARASEAARDWADRVRLQEAKDRAQDGY